MIERNEHDANKAWHVATAREAEIHKEAILSQMGEWFIAELVDGKVEGRGYGGNVNKCVPEKFGHLVILKNRKEKVQLGMTVFNS